MAEITMPRLSDTMSEGAVGRWLKKPGDRVETGDVIAEIETDKATLDLEAFESGTLQKILVPEGQTVPIGQTIAIIGDGPVEEVQESAPDSAAQQAPMEEGAPESTTRNTAEVRAQTESPGAEPAAASAAEPAAPAAEPAAEPAAPAAAPATAQQGNGRPSGERIIASPVAKRIAEELGIDLRQVQGTGPGGRIIKENVEEFHQARAKAPAAAPSAPAPAAAPGAPAAAAPAGKVRPMSRIRRAVARAMTESKPGVPHIYVTSEIDMTAALKLRQELNAGEDLDVKISVNDMVLKAAARALRKFPALNSSYATTEDGQPGIIEHEQINLSIAVALDEGLVAPVVKDADRLSLSELASQVKDLAARAREGKLKQPELEGATFQVSNMGMLDVLTFVSVITPPQSASLAVGAVRRVPVVQEDGQLGVSQVMQVCLSVDHRVTDGATAARYLQELKRLLQAPLRMIA